MTQNEYREIVAFLRRNFPNAKKYQDRDTLNDGWLLVKDMDAQEITDAAMAYMKAYPYPPDMAELVRQEKPAPVYRERDGDYIPPCMLIHEKGGVVGETMRRYFPDPVCDSCERRGDEMRCYGLLFGGKDNG